MQVIDSNYSVEEDSGDVILKNSSGNDVLTINEDGTLINNTSVYLELSDTRNSDFVELLVKSGDDALARIALRYSAPRFSFTKDLDHANTLLSTIDNSIIIYLQSNLYSLRESYGEETSGRKIFFRDPFASSFQLSSFVQSDLSAFENYTQERGLGWNGDNKSLLSFAAGKSVGESTKDYMSFGLINL